MIMRCLFAILLIYWCPWLSAQQGYLFVMGTDTANQTSLWQVNTATGNPKMLFDHAVRDMAQSGDTLFVLQGPGVLYSYDVGLQQVVDSLLVASAVQVAVSGHKVALISGLAPKLQVIDRYSGQPVFIPSPTVDDAVDITFAGDTLWVARPDTVQRYLTHQGYALSEAFTPDPFGFVNASANRYLWVHQGRAYVQRDYTTGAPRVAWLSYDVGSLAIDTAFFDIYFSNARPVPAGDNIYLHRYDDHYSIPQQQLVTNVAPSSLFPIAWDEDSGHLFAIESIDGSVQKAIPGSSWSVLTHLPYRGDFIRRQGLYIADIVQSQSPPKAKSIRLYPNPATDLITVSLPEGPFTVRITNASGQLMHYENTSTSKVQFDIAAWPAGVYWVKVFMENSFMEAIPFVKP